MNNTDLANIKRAFDEAGVRYLVTNEGTASCELRIGDGGCDMNFDEHGWYQFTYDRSRWDGTNETPEDAL